MKKGMLAFSASQVAALRILLAFLFFLPFGIVHYKKEFLVHWKAFFVMGVFGNLIPAFLFTEAETVISSSLAGILNSLTPIFTLILGVAFYNSNANHKNLIGVLLGLIGASGLLYFSGNGMVYGSLLYGMMVVLATLCYAISVNVIRHKLGGVNPVTASVWAMTFIGPIAGLYLFSTNFIHVLKENALAASSLGYTALLGVFGTAISVIFFNKLIHSTSALFASSVTYFIPLVAVFWGILAGEAILPISFVFMALIILGVYLINHKKG